MVSAVFQNQVQIAQLLFFFLLVFCYGFESCSHMKIRSHLARQQVHFLRYVHWTRSDFCLSSLSFFFTCWIYVSFFFPYEICDSFVQSIPFMLCSDIRYLILLVYILYKGKEITQPLKETIYFFSFLCHSICFSLPVPNFLRFCWCLWRSTMPKWIGCNLGFQAKSTLWKIPVLAQQDMDAPLCIWCLWFEPVIPLGK